MIPAALGGMEAPVTDVMDVMERIAAVDGSTGWCAAIGAGSNVFAGYMPATGADIVFADPDQCSATMFAPLGRVVNEDGRAVLSGRWPFTSNCLHSAWIGLGALFQEAEGVDPVLWRLPIYTTLMPLLAAVALGIAGARSTRFRGRHAPAGPHGGANWSTRRCRWPNWPRRHAAAGSPRRIARRGR
jgi:predicted metal-binding membrane protein